MIYHLEETYLKKKALRATRQQKAKEKKALKKTYLRSPTAPPQGEPKAVADPQPSHPISEHPPPPHKHLSSARKQDTPKGHYSTLTEINGLCGRTIIQIRLFSNHPTFILRLPPRHKKTPSPHDFTISWISTLGWHE